MTYAAPADVLAAIDAHRDYVTGETLALALAPAEGDLAGDATTETDLGTGPVRIAVLRSAS